MAASVSIASEDVVRLMLQFLKESNLKRTLECLQSEAEVGLNTVESTEVFLGDVQAGRWESVLPQVSSMRLPNDKVVPLYEQVLFELLEAGERELCREFLRATPCLLGLKTSDPQRHARLEHLCSRATFSALDCYEFQQTKETRRADLASSLASEVSVAPPSRLLALLGQAVKYQQLQGGGGAGGAGAAAGGGAGFDLFRGSRRASRRDVDEKVIRRLCGQIKFPPGSHAETALFSPDGISLVTGSVDGFVEVWDYESCKLRKVRVCVCVCVVCSILSATVLLPLFSDAFHRLSLTPSTLPLPPTPPTPAPRRTSSTKPATPSWRTTRSSALCCARPSAATPST